MRLPYLKENMESRHSRIGSSPRQPSVKFALLSVLGETLGDRCSFCEARLGIGMLEVSSKTRSDASREQRAFKTRRQPVLNVVLYEISFAGRMCTKRGNHSTNDSRTH